MMRFLRFKMPAQSPGEFNFMHEGEQIGPWDPYVAGVKAIAGVVILEEGAEPAVDLAALAELVENLPELRKLKDWKPRTARGAGSR